MRRAVYIADGGKIKEDLGNEESTPMDAGVTPAGSCRVFVENANDDAKRPKIERCHARRELRLP
jgi:hypothetical protein